MRALLASVCLTALALPALAQDAALILGVERYERLDRVTRGDDVLDGVTGLEALGFEVQSRANPRGDIAADLAGAFAEAADDAERLVVVLTGHFVTDGARTWLLTAEAEAPTLFGMGGAALSVDSLLAVLAARPGQAILLLGVAEAGDLDETDPVLAAGVGEMAIPQGVTVVRTTPLVAARTLATDLAEPEADIGMQLRLNPSLFVSGYLPETFVLMPPAIVVEPVAVTDPTPTQDQLTAEAQAWDRATAADTVEAYRAYIRAYPAGRFVEVAEESIAAIIAEPNRNARLAEEALNLTRDARRQVQSDLTVLGYDTRGIDGIIGPGSRRAITNWQQSNGYPQTSYLSLEQINRISAQAERRRAEIEAEEAAARAEAERLDREYWAETGALGDEAGYRAYLQRYPRGLFADVANRRLEAIEAERREEAEAEDRVAWGRAAAENTERAYQNYLAAYPNGVFAEEARDRLEAMQQPAGPTQAQIAQARAQEQALGLSGVRAQLLELRLRDLGFNPGRLDGVIDDDTREALARYQASVGIAATGYLDQGTLVGLMAGATGR